MLRVSFVSLNLDPEHAETKRFKMLCEQGGSANVRYQQ